MSLITGGSTHCKNPEVLCNILTLPIDVDGEADNNGFYVYSTNNI